MINPNEILSQCKSHCNCWYKLLLGVHNSEVNVSKFIDVTIEPSPQIDQDIGISVYTYPS